MLRGLPKIGDRDRALRLAACLLAGAAVTVSVFLFYGSLDWRPLRGTVLQYFILLLSPVVAGAVVTMLLAPRGAHWWLGAVLGCALGAVYAALYFGLGEGVARQLWLQFGLSFGFVALAGLTGAVGGLLGWGALCTLIPSPCRNIREI